MGDLRPLQIFRRIIIPKGLISLDSCKYGTMYCHTQKILQQPAPPAQISVLGTILTATPSHSFMADNRIFTYLQQMQSKQLGRRNQSQKFLMKFWKNSVEEIQHCSIHARPSNFKLYTDSTTPRLGLVSLRTPHILRNSDFRGLSEIEGPTLIGFRLLLCNLEVNTQTVTSNH